MHVFASAWPRRRGCEIVGVATTVRQQVFGPQPDPVVFLPFRASPSADHRHRPAARLEIRPSRLRGCARAAAVSIPICRSTA